MPTKSRYKLLLELFLVTNKRAVFFGLGRECSVNRAGIVAATDVSVFPFGPVTCPSLRRNRPLNYNKRTSPVLTTYVILTKFMLAVVNKLLGVRNVQQGCD